MKYLTKLPDVYFSLQYFPSFKLLRKSYLVIQIKLRVHAIILNWTIHRFYSRTANSFYVLSSRTCWVSFLKLKAFHSKLNGDTFVSRLIHFYYFYFSFEVNFPELPILPQNVIRIGFHFFVAMLNRPNWSLSHPFSIYIGL